MAHLAMFMAARVVVIDPKSYSVLQRYLSPHKLHKVPNMIDLDRLDRLRNEEPQDAKRRISMEAHLLFAGRVVRDKGIIEMVEACCQLPGVDLHLIGPFDEAFCKQLCHLAQPRETGQWLHFYGQMENDEVYRHILLSDIILLPSYYEGFPLVILESMALGKPVVAGDVGAIAEMIDIQGEFPCGVCVPPKDTAALQSALQRLLEQREKWEEMGQHGRRRVEAFYSTKSVMGKLEALWVDMRRPNRSQRDKQCPASISG